MITAKRLTAQFFYGKKKPYVGVNRANCPKGKTFYGKMSTGEKPVVETWTSMKKTIYSLIHADSKSLI